MKVRTKLGLRDCEIITRGERHSTVMVPFTDQEKHNARTGSPLCHFWQVRNSILVKE